MNVSMGLQMHSYASVLVDRDITRKLQRRMAENRLCDILSFEIKLINRES